MRRAPILVAVLVSAAILASGVRTLSPAVAQLDPGTRPVELLAGWNLVAWTGAETPVEEALGEAISSIDSVHTFDGGRQAFDTFTTTGPSFLNSLAAIAGGAGVWLFANADVTWEQPRIAGPRDVNLVAGFNLVGWTGPGAFIGEAVAGIAETLDSLFMWDAPAEEFLTFGPTRPAFLNRIDALAYGDGFWLLMKEAASWAQPDAGPETVITSEDGSVTRTIPPGALPAGVSASAITLETFDGGPDALVSVLIGPEGTVFDPPATLSFVAPEGVTAALVASVADLDVRVAEAVVRAPGGEVGAAQLPEGEVLDLLVAMDQAGDYFLFETPFEASLVGEREQALLGQELIYRPTVENLTREFSFFALISPPGDAADAFPDPVPTAVLSVGLIGAFTMNPGRVCEVFGSTPFSPGTCRSVESLVSPVEHAPIPAAPVRSTPVAGADTANLQEATAAPVAFRCLRTGAAEFEQKIAVTQTVVVGARQGESRERELEILPTSTAATGRCWAVSATNPHLLVTSGQPIQRELHVVLADEDEFDEDDGDFRLAQATGGIRIRPLLPGDIVVTPEGEFLTAAQAAAQPNGLLSINPVVLNGTYESVGGTCGFGDFSDSFQLFEHEGYRVIPGEGNAFEIDGLNLAPDDLLPGVVGIYTGELSADGTGTLNHFHVEDGCTQQWRVELTNPRELNLPFPPVDVP